MSAKDFIVAIELGSSKLRAIAGRKNPDGSISVLAVTSEDSPAFIHKGIVYNIEKTVQGITNVVNKLKASLNREISQVYVGVGGQSILGVKNEIIRDLPKDTMIDQKMVDELVDSNRNKRYADKRILDVAIQEYKVGNDLQNDPAGIQADRLTGTFLNILWRDTFYNRLNDCFDRAGVRIAELYIAPIALADCLLDDVKKRSGCLLVDLGADTTSVLVYHKNIIRHIAVIPLGSNNITKDIATLNMEEDAAEKMKRKYGNAYMDSRDIDKSLEYSIDTEHSVASSKFQHVVEARVQEIVENVWNQVPAEYNSKLNGGIVLTGGGANLKNIATAFRKFTGMDKVTVSLFINDNVNATKQNAVPHDGTMNTLLGLLVKGDQNCDGGDLRGDIFGEPAPVMREGVAMPKPGSGYVAGENTGGRVPTRGEAERLEKERKQQEENDWSATKEDDTVAAYNDFKEKHPESEHVAEADKRISELSTNNKMGNKLNKLWQRFERLVAAEEED